MRMRERMFTSGPSKVLDRQRFIGDTRHFSEAPISAVDQALARGRFLVLDQLSTIDGMRFKSFGVVL